MSSARVGHGPAPAPASAAATHWGAEALWQQLDPLLPGLSVEVVARTDSTNTRLLERARHGRDTQPCLLVAEHQTAGRGRLGREWVGAVGASLSFSLALPMAPRAWSGLSLTVGLALADALEPLALGSPRIVLKWPNDLWLLDGPGRGRKLGGILIETLSVGERRLCVVGVGLNVLPQSAHGPSAGSACLQEIYPGISAPAALATVAVPLVRSLLKFAQTGFAPFLAGYARRDLLAGLAVSTTAPGVPHGVAEGVDEHGALRVRAGVVHRLVSGEVSVRLAPAAAAA